MGSTLTDGSNKSAAITVIVEPANPLSLDSLGFGIYNYNLLALTVTNKCQVRKITDIEFDMTMYDYSGNIVNKGSFSLGKPVQIGPQSKKTIKRTIFGVGQAYRVTIMITGVYFPDYGEYIIPSEKRETWTFTRN